LQDLVDVEGNVVRDPVEHTSEENRRRVVTMAIENIQYACGVKGREGIMRADAVVADTRKRMIL